MFFPYPQVINRRVRSLEGAYLAEYGFPSTHTMSVMGQACIIVWYTWRIDYVGEKTYPLEFAMMIASIFVAITAVGRLYLGVHTSPDILGGLVLEGAIFSVYTKIADPLDRLVLKNDVTLFLPTLIFVVFLLIYPRPRRWTNA